MDKQQAEYFGKLTANRAEDAKALEGFALSGVKNSVVEKYSDQAHFIYELLQNADDAKATSVRFELFRDKLIFAHNGTRRFSVSDPADEFQDRKNGILGDINAITAVGKSNKADATIGKFGVGFKAVFQYTVTPHIYDPNVFFKIERFIVPTPLPEDYAGRGKDETLFVFPFDHSKRTPENAYSDISEKLCSLDHPLLFLSNIKGISFNISGIHGSYGKKVEETLTFNDVTAEFITLTQDNGENRVSALWLFSRDYEKKHRYSAGFFVDAEVLPHGLLGRLKPQKYSAFCFFPTKETSGLNFIIHAPFLLTDSREGIRAGEEHNIKMISLLSELAADSFLYLKEIGESKNAPLIDDNIFDIVPYNEGDFDDVSSKKRISFKPFYTAIKEVFESEVIIPALDGYAEAADAYWAFVPQIAKLFSNEQLAALTGNKTAKWVFKSFGYQGIFRQDKPLSEYLDSITSGRLDENNILGGMITPGFIEAQSIEWLHSFYKWIAETKGRTELILTKPIFLNQDGKAAAAFDAKRQAILFLPTEDGDGYATVNEALTQNEETLAFIKQLGVKEPSLRDEIYNIILPKYRSGRRIDTRPHFMKFFRYYQSCSQSEAKEFLSLIRNHSFVLYTTGGSEIKYRGKAGELYFPTEPLHRWFQQKPSTKFVSFDEYLELAGRDKEERLTVFLTDLGVKDIPRIYARILTEDEANEIRPLDEWPQPSSNKMDTKKWTEWFIDGCEKNIQQIVDEENAEHSLFVWKQLLRFTESGYFKSSYSWSHDSVLYGLYEYFFRTQQKHPFESNEAKRLHKEAWLMNADGEFFSPVELTAQTLNPQYDTSSDEARELLRVLGIDKAVDISSYAKELGLSEEEHRQAIAEFARRKQGAESGGNKEGDKGIDSSSDPDDDIDNGIDDDSLALTPSVKRVVRDIEKRVAAPKESPSSSGDTDDAPADEDEYSKPPVDIGKKIERIKEKTAREVREIEHLEALKQQAQEADRYTYAWFKALLELESINSGENNADSREISISFAKVEREEGTSRTLILKHPNRYIPQYMEDLTDIPLELRFEGQPPVKAAIEVVSVKSYTLRAKLKTNAHIDGDLSLVTEARIEAKNPVFLIEELRRAFVRLGKDNQYEDDFDMRKNLCENIEFVFGPPGTGKTTHLARNVIIPMMKEAANLKVLVLTPTNKSADVLTRMLMESADCLDWLVRFGVTNDNTIEHSGVFRDKTFDIRTFPRSVTVTTIARFPYDFFMPDDTRLHLNALNWDCVIIDEASMIPLANIVYPLYKKTPRKFIIAGDPFQIEPITTVDIWKNENIYTMVKLDSFTKPATVPHDYHVELLTTQYRSIPEIGGVFSRFAYGGVLKHARTSESRHPLHIDDFMDLKPLNIIKFPVKKFESIYRPKRLQSKSAYQVYSALFAFEFMKYLSSHIKPEQRSKIFRIGLIAPYRAQADLINKLMVPALLPPNINVQIGTIHGFQGDECDIIIALFNPPPSISAHKDMFLNKLNIVNVSISRARDYLFILMPDGETENVGNLKLINKVEQLCKEQPGWSERHSPDIEEAMFGNKRYLEENSFSTSHQMVNVYGKPEKLYEIRSEDNAVDVQVVPYRLIRSADGAAATGKLGSREVLPLERGPARIAARRNIERQ
jgi:hypothetical protein